MGKTHGGLALHPAWSQESFGQLVAAVGIFALIHSIRLFL